jgi:hypothetical protein
VIKAVSGAVVLAAVLASVPFNLRQIIIRNANDCDNINPPLSCLTDYASWPPHDASWPLYDAQVQIIVGKIDDENLETDGTCEFGVTAHTTNNCDPHWVHLHQGHAPAESAGLKLHPWSRNNDYAGNSIWGRVDFGFEAKYYIGGVAVTDWIGYPWEATIEWDNPALASFKCGIYDVTVDIRYNGSNSGTASTTVLSAASTSVFTVQSGQGANFAIGDHIWLLRAPDGAYPYEFREVSNVSGDTVTVSSGFYAGFGNPVAGDFVHIMKRDDFRVRAGFVHFHLTGHPNGVASTVPLIDMDAIYIVQNNDQGPRSSVEYVDFNDANPRAWPLVDQGPDPWTEIPCAECGTPADLYQVQLAPHTEQLTYSLQMWWQEPAGTVDAGLPFARGMVSKHDETHFYPNLHEGVYGHNRFPYIDGERGKCWMSPYATGRVDSSGRLIFTEPGGRFGYQDATGKCETWAGYRTKLNQFPVWITKTLSDIRAGQDLIGTWPGGIETFRNPIDVDIDPQNPTHYYIVDEGWNLIFKCVLSGGACTMTVFAGATDGTAGYTNATGTSARFSGPTSLAWDAAGDYLYVTDLKNDAVRRIDRSGVVTTLFGQGPSDGTRATAILPEGTGSGYQINNGGGYSGGTTTVAVDTGTGTILVGDIVTFAGVSSYYTVTSALSAGSFSFTPGLAGAVANDAAVAFCATTVYGNPAPTTNRTCSRFTGTDPDSMSPFVIRRDSNDDLIVMDAGFSAIRRYDIATDTATKIVYMGNPRYESATGIGWQWMDVDRWGNSGPQDGIYFGCFQCSNFTEVSGTRTNEGFAWSSSDGSQQYFVFGPDNDATPDGFGSYYYSDLPHYFWLAAVDPRGGVYLNGGGEHGTTLLRKKVAGDPDPDSLSDYIAGERLWALGSDSFATVVRPSKMVKYGYAGNGSMLGYASTWDITTSTTDAEIKAMFGISDAIWNDTDKKRQILDFLRANRGSELAPPSPAPAPVALFSTKNPLRWMADFKRILFGMGAPK